MNNISGIYCVENKINGKKYIGQAQNLNKRISRHKCNLKMDIWEDTSPRENKPLWLATKKYGIENFKYYIIEYCDIASLDKLEIQHIKELSSHYSLGGYNLSWGGGTCRGVKATNIARKNMSLAHIGEKHTKEHNEKIGKAHIGKKYSNAKSKYFGVYYSKTHNLWAVDIKEKNLRFSKWFKEEVLAAKYYNECVLRYGLQRPLNAIGA